MTKKIYKQWELPRKANVKLESGKVLVFEKMDGMYAHWLTSEGEACIGNYNGFTKGPKFFYPI